VRASLFGLGGRCLLKVCSPPVVQEQEQFWSLKSTMKHEDDETRTITMTDIATSAHPV
jgi:hypothetical protein